MEFENTNVYNMLQAVRAIRYSYSSEEKSDSSMVVEGASYEDYYGDGSFFKVRESFRVLIGDNDKRLIESLVKAGPSHRKFMRQILVSVDITAPRYWWTQFDTYKVGVTANSESTMHTLMKRDLVKEDFSFPIDDQLLQQLNIMRGFNHFEELVGYLPQGYLQKRHVTMNYEVVRNIREQREGHKLKEWKDFMEWAAVLPYSDLFLWEE